MEENNQEQQELIFKLSIFEQQIKAIQEQIQAVDQAIFESNSLKFDLDDLKKAKDKEILAGLGKGIFIKAKINSENLIVDVGDKTFVNKSVENTQKLIGEQIKKLESIRKELEEKLEEINEELTKTFMSVQNKKAN